jgi:hypothetical protein
VSQFPVSCCLSAVGIRFLGHPAPAGELSLPHGRPTGGQPTGPQRGCRVAHEQDPTGQGAPFTPGTVVRSRPATILRPAPTASQRPVPTTPLEHPIGGANLHEASSGVHSRSPITPRRLDTALRAGKQALLPASLLLACDPRMEHGPLRLRPRASHPAVTHDARRGGDRPSRTDPGTTPSTSAEPPRRLPLHSCTLTSHVIGGRLHHHPGHAQRPQPVRQRQ